MGCVAVKLFGVFEKMREVGSKPGIFIFCVLGKPFNLGRASLEGFLFESVLDDPAGNSLLVNTVWVKFSVTSDIYSVGVWVNVCYTWAIAWVAPASCHELDLKGGERFSRGQ